MKYVWKGLILEGEDFWLKLWCRWMSYIKLISNSMFIDDVRVIMVMSFELSLWYLLFGFNLDGSWLVGFGGEIIFFGNWGGGGGGRFI